jgi:RHS repeat-associated protein
MKFTGQERDLRDPSNTTDDLDYLHARYDNPNLGRFLSTDPMRGNPASPQSWNLYSYVQDNPVNTWDPLGLAVAKGRAGQAGSASSATCDGAGDARPQCQDLIPAGFFGWDLPPWVERVEVWGDTFFGGLEGRSAGSLPSVIQSPAPSGVASQLKPSAFDFLDIQGTINFPALALRALRIPIPLVISGEVAMNQDGVDANLFLQPGAGVSLVIGPSWTWGSKPATPASALGFNATAGRLGGVSVTLVTYGDGRTALQVTPGLALGVSGRTPVMTIPVESWHWSW